MHHLVGYLVIYDCYGYLSFVHEILNGKVDKVLAHSPLLHVFVPIKYTATQCVERLSVAARQIMVLSASCQARHIVGTMPVCSCSPVVRGFDYGVVLLSGDSNVNTGTLGPDTARKSEMLYLRTLYYLLRSCT